MLESIELKNFMGFPEIAVELSPGINIFIGENGVGKTNFLKAAYGLCSAGPLLSCHPNWDTKTLEDELTRKFVRLFLPLDDKLGNMHHTGAKGVASLTARFANDQEITAVFTEKSDKLEIRYSEDLHTLAESPVFVPSKEVLSFMLGFASLYDKYEISFDQTYKDICMLLDHPKIRKENLSLEVQNAINEIEKISQGIFQFYGGGRVTFKTENEEYSANAVGEGIRKIGILARLLKTGAIQPGVSGPLFWDEPDSNLNPQMMNLLVNILYSLAKNGQQIILATHDYVLLKWFEMIADDKQKIYFYSMYNNNKNICISKTDEYINLEHNSIDDTYDELIDYYITKNNMLS